MVIATRRDANRAAVGDVKHGYQQADHDGWFLMNGRPVVALTLKAQESATSIGLGSSLPDMGNKTAFGAASPSYVGDLSGGNFIQRKNLPNEGLAYSGTSSANNRGHTHQIDPPATDSGTESADHTHGIPALTGSTTANDATSQYVPLGDFAWVSDYGSDQGGSGRTYAYQSGSRSVGYGTLNHSHSVNTAANNTGGRSTTHTHTTNIAEFASKAESQNHTHAYSGTTESMSGGDTQVSFMAAHLKLNYFVYLGE